MGMTPEYIHEVPGRFRIRLFELKGKPDAAARIEALLKAVSGVKSVHANAITGSVLVYHDPGAADVSSILTTAGITWPLSRPHAPSSKPDTAPLHDRFVKAVLWYAVEKVVERSVPLLLAAIA